MIWFLTFLSGSVAALAMQPFNIFPALFVGISGFWLILSSRTRKRDGYIHGFLFGLGYFLAGIWWVGNALLVGGNPYLWALPLAVVGLQSLLALYPMIAGGLIVTFARGRTLTSFLFFVGVMGLFEWVRGHALTGFPWNLFGMAWADYLPIAQLASLTGIYGLSLLTILVCAWPAFLFKGDLIKADKIRLSILLITIIASVFAYGMARLNNHPTTYHDDVAVRVISPNIPQDDKWNPILYAQNFAKTVDAMNPFFGTYKNSAARTRVLVLPETAFNSGVFADSGAIRMLQDTLNQYKGDTYLFTGGLRVEPNSEQSNYTYFNSLIAFDQNMKFVTMFDKAHLVPFGEYIPFQKYIPIGPVTKFEGLSKGKGLDTWNIPSIPPVSPLVCYEIIFPGAVINKNILPRAEWIVNATNDAWYGISPGPYQHLALTRMRAIEEGVPVVRSANTGISAIIDSYGRILYQSELFKTDAFETRLPRAIGTRTFYASWTDSVFFVFVLILCAPLICASVVAHRKSANIP